MSSSSLTWLSYCSSASVIWPNGEADVVGFAEGIVADATEILRISKLGMATRRIGIRSWVPRPRPETTPPRMLGQPAPPRTRPMAGQCGSGRSGSKLPSLIKTHNHDIHGTVRPGHRLKQCPPPKSCGGKTGGFQNGTPLTSKRTNGKEQAARLFRTNGKEQATRSSHGSKGKRAIAEKETGKRAIAEKVTPPKVDNKVDSVGDTKVGAGESTKWGPIPILQGPTNWAILLNGKYIQITEDIIEMIRADPLHIWGWYQEEVARAWEEIAPRILAEDSPDLLRLTDLPLSELRLVQFLEEVYSVTLPEFDERKVPLSVSFNLAWRGNLASLKLVQIAKCIPQSSIIVRCSEEVGAGFLSYLCKVSAVKNLFWEMWPEKAWNSLEAKGSLFPTSNPHFMSNHDIGVNILTWNCRGVLNTCFRRAFLDLLHNTNPQVLILTETRLGGTRAMVLARSFPFDGFLCTKTIGFAGGIWILWKTDAVNLELLCSTEQEIHVSVKVSDSDPFGLLSVIYASPRQSERRILWNNLATIASLHNLPWVMVDVSSLIMQRLDRALANPEWRTLFPDALVSHLTHTDSDHCPILLSLHHNPNCPLPRPFRFESFWLSHPEFPSIVDKAWALPAVNLKKRILARMNGAQNALALNPTESLSRLERSLREEFSSILQIEEEFWALKSRVGWVVDGDRNTKFFHTSTIIRRRFNKIVRLQNNVGEWLESSDLIKQHIQSSFIDLFASSHISSIPTICPSSLAPQVLMEESGALTAPITLSDEVSHTFQSGKMPEYLNSTLIALIPKCRGLETIGQYRPISLCNTIYKVVTKIIVNRVRPLLDKLVSPYQTAFVPGRRGVDNVIIAQELIHSLYKKQGREGQFILKLDLEKAYDRLEWSFIREVLLFFNFPIALVNLILDCVSSSSISIIFNGGQMEVFKPSRGISNKRWKPIKASRSGPDFSHLFFADDLLLCSEASVECCHVISEVLDDFCHLSSQKVSLSKSKVFFSPNVSSDLRSSLCGILGVSSTPNLGWKKVCHPKKEGGLGLSCAKPRNVALLAKLNWRLIEEKDSPWAKTILAKYFPNGFANSQTLRVSFWHDRWIGDVSHRSLVQGPLSLSESLLRVCDVVGSGSVWNLAGLSLLLPTSVVEAIRGTYVCSFNPKEDCLAWDSNKGDFSSKLALQLANKHPFVLSSNLSDPSWIWKVDASPRIRFFLWQCYHDSVPMRDTLLARGLNIPHGCPRCSCPFESLSHTLRDCPDSISIWNNLSIPISCSQSFTFPLLDWISFNCSSSKAHDKSHIAWQTVFSFGLWTIWLRRNLLAFNSSPMLLDPIRNILSFASEFFCLMGDKSNSKFVSSIAVKWVPPTLGRAKLNTDGSSLGNPGVAGGGGVIRDSCGTWVRGFSRTIGHTTSVQAELRALLDGMQLALELHITYLDIEMDSLVSVDLVLSKSVANIFFSPIVDDCRCMMEKFASVTLKHIYREANACVDLLAKEGCSQVLPFIAFTTPPMSVLECLAFDCSNFVYTRLIKC
uniref:RNase H type-1 domain-containing protein n=1 Tax=Fagus sylvatica TaxID=28930 RepID=A0A2N9F8F6_FAGSY